MDPASGSVRMRPKGDLEQATKPQRRPSLQLQLPHHTQSASSSAPFAQLPTNLISENAYRPPGSSGLQLEQEEPLSSWPGGMTSRPLANLEEQTNGSAGVQLLPPGDAGPKQAGGQSHFLDRLSSIELLFLISSLMFLVLLALGLATSYYCLSSGAKRGRARRRRAAQLPSLASRRPGDSTGAASLGPALLLSGSGGGGGGQRTLSADEMLKRQQQQRHVYPASGHAHAPTAGWPAAQAAPLLYAGGKQVTPLRRAHTQTVGRAPLQSSSSPDEATSDLSSGHQVLLPASSTRPSHQALGGATHSLGRPTKTATLRPLVLGRRGTSSAAGQPAETVYAERLGQTSANTLGRRYQQQHHQRHLDALGRISGPSAAKPQEATYAASYGLNGRQGRQTGPARARQWTGGRRGDTGSHTLGPECDQSGAASGAGSQPRLVLQCIDDTFITKFTEVEEQEYTKSDSMNVPLSWADWAAASNAALRAEVASRPSASARLPSASSTSISSAGSTADEEDDEARSLQQANLRSLTELDVNFAKSLLRGSSGTAFGEQHGEQQEPTAASSTLQSRGQTGAPRSRPEEAGSDLVISPEYDWPGGSSPAPNSSAAKGAISAQDKDSRPLRLTIGRPPSAQSHESISYV